MDELLCSAFARVGKWGVSAFNAQDFANASWAFATVDLSDELLFAALAREA